MRGHTGHIRGCSSSWSWVFYLCSTVAYLKKQDARAGRREGAAHNTGTQQKVIFFSTQVLLSTSHLPTTASTGVARHRPRTAGQMDVLGDNPHPAATRRDFSSPRAAHPLLGELPGLVPLEIHSSQMQPKVSRLQKSVGDTSVQLLQNNVLESLDTFQTVTK